MLTLQWGSLVGPHKRRKMAYFRAILWPCAWGSSGLALRVLQLGFPDPLGALELTHQFRIWHIMMDHTCYATHWAGHWDYRYRPRLQGTESKPMMVFGTQALCSFLGWSPNPVKETHRTSEFGNLSLSPISVTYCCLVIFPQLRAFKQHIFTISQFLWIQSPGKAYLRSLLTIPHCSQEVSWGCDLIWNSTRKRSAAAC